MTPRAVERLRPMMQRRADVILDALEDRNAFDAYLDFAARLPTQVMLDLLGLPDADELMMRHWSDRCSNFLFQPVSPDNDMVGVSARTRIQSACPEGKFNEPGSCFPVFNVEEKQSLTK